MALVLGMLALDLGDFHLDWPGKLSLGIIATGLAISVVARLLWPPKHKEIKKAA